MIRRLEAGLIAILLALGPTGAGGVLALDQTDDAYPALGDPLLLEDGTLTVAAPGVLANDDAPAACAEVSALPGHGTLDLLPDGGFTYTGASDYNGTDTFQYAVDEACGSGTPGTPATVTITITPVNDAPTVAATGACATGDVDVQEDSGAYDSACVSVTFGPDNESGQSLAEWIVSTQGTLSFSAGPSITTDGRLQFTPSANACGSVTMSVAARDDGGTANDGIDTSTAVELSINVACVNDAPTAASDGFIVLEDRTLNVRAPGVLVNDDDIESTSLTAVKVSNPSHGVVTLAADGSFSYTPAAGYTGPDAFSYKASDGSLFSPTRVVSLTVKAIPVVATPTPIPTPEVTPEPTPAETPAEPSPSVEPSPSPEPTLPPVETVAPTVAASPTPASSQPPGPTDEDGGGISLPVLLVIILFVLLVGFGAALYAPKWLAAQRGEPPDPE